MTTRTLGSLGAVLVAVGAAVGSIGCVKSQEDVTGVRSAVLTNVTVTVKDTDNVAQPNVTVFWQKNNGAQGGWTDTDSTARAVLSVDNGSYFFGATLPTNTYYSGTTAHCTTPGCTSATITVQKPV